MASDSKLTFTPRWDGAIERYARAFAARNHWRVRQLCDPEDSVAEAMVVYAKCARAYAGKVDNAAWFMALYKKALANYWTQLARQNRRRAQAAAAIAEAAQWVPRSEPATAPVLVMLGEIRRRHPIGGDPPTVLSWLLGGPHEILPQCGRLTARRVVRDLLEAA